MNFEDAELTAMSDISKILNSLNSDARVRVLRWVGDKFYKNDVNFSHTRNDEPVNTENLLQVEDTRQLAEFNNISDFIETTLSDRFDSLQMNDQILIAAYFLENYKGQSSFTNKQILDELKPLGIEPSNMTVYIKRLSEKRFVYGVDKGNSITKKGNDHVTNLFETLPTPSQKATEGTIDLEVQNNETKKKPKPKNKKRKPDNVGVDKDLLKKLDEKTPKFSDFLAQYDLEKNSSSSAFITLSVLYLTEFMDKDAVTLQEIATCFKLGHKTPPDYFRQAVTDTANKQGYILYDGPESIQILSKGRSFLDSIKV